MQEIQAETTGTIVRIRAASGTVRWYRICAICADTDEIAEPKTPDTVPALCPVCIEETAEVVGDAMRREATQEAFDMHRLFYG